MRKVIGEKGEAYARVILFKTWKQEHMAPGEKRQIATFKKYLHVTKGFRPVEIEYKDA